MAEVCRLVEERGSYIEHVICMACWLYGVLRWRLITCDRVATCALTDQGWFHSSQSRRSRCGG